MVDKFKEVWNKLTLVSKTLIIASYLIISFPLFLSVKTIEAGTLMFYWFILSALINSIPIVFFASLAMNKLKTSTAFFILLTSGGLLFLENPEIGFIRLIFSMICGFLIIFLISFIVSMIIFSGEFITKLKGTKLKKLFIKN